MPMLMTMLRGCSQDFAQLWAAANARPAAAADGRRAEVPSAETIAAHVEALLGGGKVADPEMLQIFTDLLTYVKDEARLARLLAMLPACSPLGCLSPIACALYHANSAVRSMAATILRVIECHKAAQPVVSALNPALLAGLDAAVAAQSKQQQSQRRSSR